MYQQLFLTKQSSKMRIRRKTEFILKKKYRVLRKIGSGSFGDIYTCEDMENNKQYAVKFQKDSLFVGQLDFEVHLYQNFQGINGIAKLIDHGIEEQKTFMIMDLLGSSLDEIFQLHKQKFTIPTIFNIAIQIITRLEDIHKRGYIHRDIKPNNFVIGKDAKENTVFIIDFGLMKRYIDQKNGQHIPLRKGKCLIGTARYASIASHLGFQQGRKDDLESLGFLLLYFLRGKLPWQGVTIENKIQKYRAIGKMKSQTPIEEICQPAGDHAKPLVDFFKHVRSLQFEDRPDYEKLRNLFEKELKVMDSSPLDLDWLKNKQATKLK